ncbi:MAG TPA: SRPBCC family protein [bacterium]|nr:SRPBCC family protein [bacterium]HMW34060.1 SRPBCC family protein [bacterium]HMW36067.1 SRPBCC family protein [bacterium]HMY36917.1 SRPBCC family protein [bacterium]HMZ04822.1 SRPBCC family protein [bacterium]
MHVLEREQTLSCTLLDAWQFLSSPQNLKLITPPYMGFEIRSDQNGKPMHAGMIITYRVSPLFNIPMTWVTEITHVREPYYFVDEQRIGPYTLWHHQHFLEAVEGGVRMRDCVHYKLPMGIIGNQIEKWIVRRRLESIFDFRWRKLNEIFNAPS